MSDILRASTFHSSARKIGFAPPEEQVISSITVPPISAERAVALFDTALKAYTHQVQCRPLVI